MKTKRAKTTVRKTARKKVQKRPLNQKEFTILWRIAQAICIIFPAGLIVLITGMATWSYFVGGFWMAFAAFRLNTLNKKMAQEYARRGRR